jgi:hypothetical protein
MNKLLYYFTLLSLLLPAACYYVDKDVYEVEPVAGDPAVVSVASNLDTLNNPPVGDSLEVFYSVTVENGEFYFMDALLSGETFYTTDSIEGSFYVYPSQSIGLDSLYMDFYHSSNTNTLADKTGYEARVTSRSYAIDFGGEALK